MRLCLYACIFNTYMQTHTQCIYIYRYIYMYTYIYVCMYVNKLPIDPPTNHLPFGPFSHYGWCSHLY